MIVLYAFSEFMRAMDAELMAAGGLYRTLVRLQYHELRRPGVSAETAQ